MFPDDSTRRIDRAQRALESYERTAFPDEPSLLQRDALYTNALLSALLCDLEHYARSRRIDFGNAVAAGHSLNTEEQYKIGDQVRLQRSGRCGTIAGWDDRPDTEHAFLIDVPGLPHLQREVGRHLSPAPPFPETITS